MKVLFITNVPSPYRVDFFNELGQLCDLTVTFEKNTSTERDKSWVNYSFDNFTGIFLKGISINTDTAFSFKIIKYIKNLSFDRIICTNYSSPTSMIAIWYMRRHKISYWLESDGGFAKSGKGIKEKIKKHFITGATGYFSTSKENDKYYIAYGADPDKIYRYPFTSLYKNDILKHITIESSKKSLKREFDITEEKVIISVGRFSYMGGYGKGFDILINAIAKLNNKIGVYIIGGEPTEEFLNMCSDLKLTNVHFVEHKSKEDLKKYYQLSDLFVLMTRGDVWGLVINEAMANGLPIITTDKCNAGLELVEDSVNGYIIPIDSPEALAKKINVIFSDDELCLEMGRNSLEKIRRYTFEEMANLHIVYLTEKKNEY